MAAFEKGVKGTYWPRKRRNKGELDPELRTVRVTGLVPVAGRPLLFAFGYADYALLCGISVQVVRDAVSGGLLDPLSLKSIIEFYCKCKGKHLISDAAFITFSEMMKLAKDPTSP